MGRPKTLPPQKTLPEPQRQQLALIDRFLAQPPIPGPKTWSDEVERAAVYHALHSAPPVMALCASGVPLGTAQDWLSDTPPEGLNRACRALAQRLKEAEQACAAGLFANIHKAAQDPKYWTAAAWTLERKHGYIAAQPTLTGPATVINIGQLHITNSTPVETPRISWRDDPGIIEAATLAEPLADGAKGQA